MGAGVRCARHIAQSHARKRECAVTPGALHAMRSTTLMRAFTATYRVETLLCSAAKDPKGVQDAGVIAKATQIVRGSVCALELHCNRAEDPRLFNHSGCRGQVHMQSSSAQRMLRAPRAAPPINGPTLLRAINGSCSCARARRRGARRRAAADVAAAAPRELWQGSGDLPSGGGGISQEEHERREAWKKEVRGYQIHTATARTHARCGTRRASAPDARRGSWQRLWTHAAVERPAAPAAVQHLAAPAHRRPREPRSGAQTAQRRSPRPSRAQQTGPPHPLAAPTVAAADV